MKVCKFGGSSLADGKGYEHAVDIIKSDPERRAIVTSAPGKRHDGDIKVTDLLIKYANAIRTGKNSKDIVDEIFGRYQAIGAYFGIPEKDVEEIKNILLALPKKDYPSDDYLMAAFKAHGERLNARLMAIVLNHLGIKARFVDSKEAGIVVTGKPDNATVAAETYDNLARLKYDNDERLIFPGFFGYTPAGNMATFARGGSDITGAILARGLHADVYENFTDVDAIFAANPSIIKDPAPIKTMTFREMRELSSAGFSVLQNEALLPAIQGDVKINVKNTAHPDLPGTMVVSENGFQPSHTITGIAGGKNFAALYLHKYLQNKEVGSTLRILNILKRHGLRYEHMPSGIDDVTIIFNKDELQGDVVDQICNEIQAEVQPDRLEFYDDYALLEIVGEGMAGKPGVSAAILDALAKENIYVPMINKGASKISIMLGINEKDFEKAVQVVYERFFK
ncbi:MAG TPA: aspartate kinase [Candidatus Limosilactobacillus merdigallinarum]|uniref:Aspartokinase n=1 Tax=Candidatus Limosilactobacillus merdigallinarum TaxID=2838652 RepID=A0A9D1VI53_9LACO|nr:aspartate kinase [Candidatus Limosilactobacillus merdigallinarum]